MQIQFANIGHQPVFPIIVTKRNSFKSVVKDQHYTDEARRYIKLGGYKESYEGSENFADSFMAFIEKNMDL